MVWGHVRAVIVGRKDEVGPVFWFWKYAVDEFFVYAHAILEEDDRGKGRKAGLEALDCGERLLCLGRDEKRLYGGSIMGV
jgi:hypothetical protein